MISFERVKENARKRGLIHTRMTFPTLRKVIQEMDEKGEEDNETSRKD